MAERDPAMECADIVVVRGDDRVIDGISLDIERGARILIRGPSGSGKSTLFEVLGLLTTPTSGTVRLDGDDVSGLPERRRAALRRSHVGFVFQDFQLIPDLTAWENARLPLEHTGTPSESETAWVSLLFDELGISDRRDAYPAALSGGERQRVAIARALANRPTVVLADEPTGQLDPDTADHVIELLFDIQSDLGTALGVVSHDRTLGENFDAVHQLVDGELVDDGASVRAGGDGHDTVRSK